jgi:hypothetical protein
MTILGSGIISLGGSTVGRSVNIELGRSATASINMNESVVRTLAGAATGAISFSNFYNKSAFSTITYNFTSTVESWTGTNTTLSANLGQMVLNSTANDPFITSPVLSFNGGSAPIIRISILRTGGTGWDGSLFYTTGGHGVSEAYKALMPQPAFDGVNYQLIEMNMSNLFAGGNDWSTNTITRIRMDFGATAADDFRIDFIQIDTGTTYAPGFYEYTAAGYHNDNANFVDAGTAVGAATTVSEPSIAENTSLAWVGYFYAPSSGNYTFNMATDDGGYLWIGSNAISGYNTGNRNVYSNFNTGTVSSAPIALTANTYTPIRMMMGNQIGPGNASLTVTLPSGTTISDGTGYFLHNSGTLGL